MAGPRRIRDLKKQIRQFDWDAPDADERIRALTDEACEASQTERLRLREQLPPELRDELDDLLHSSWRAGYLTCVQQLSRQIAQSASRLQLIKQLESKCHAQNVHLSQLNNRLATLKQLSRDAAQKQEAGQWDYEPKKKRKPKKGEVVTKYPQIVRDVARVVEDHVQRFGPCQKSDVSARFPQHEAYLADAYKHLHASRRVFVKGLRLEAWDDTAHGQRTQVIRK